MTDVNLKEDVVTNILSVFPLVFFEDGYYGEVKRLFARDNGKVILYVDPEPNILLRYPEFKKEYDSYGYLELEFDEEYVVDQNKDPASPRIRVLTDIKGERKSIIYEELLKTIEFIKGRNEHMKLCLLHQDREMNELLENFEGNIDRHERIRGKMKISSMMPMYPGMPMPNPTDSGQDGG